MEIRKMRFEKAGNAPLILWQIQSFSFTAILAETENYFLNDES